MTFDEVVGLATPSSGERWNDLIEEQRPLWAPTDTAWIVLPIAEGICAVASNSEAVRQMTEVLYAFLGRHVVGDMRRLNTVELGGETVFHLAIEVPRGPDALIDQIWTMVRTRKQIGLASPIQGSPLPVLLRDFLLAIQGRDEVLAERVYKQLEETGSLSLENLRFLRVRLDAGMGRWAELANESDFRDLVLMHRPRLVTEILLEAIWRTFLSEAYEESGENGVRRRFAELSLGARYGDLFGSVTNASRVRARSILAIYIGSTGSIDRLRWLTEGLADEETSRLWTLSGLAPVAHSSTETSADMHTGSLLSEDSPSGVVLREVDPLQLIDDGDLAGVIALYRSDPTSVRLVRHALQAVLNLEDPKEAALVVAGIERAGLVLPPERILQEFFERARNLAQGVCGSWTEWAQRISDREWPAAASALRDQAPDWSLDFLDDRENAEAVADAILSGLTGPNARALVSEFASLVGLASARPEAPFCGRVRSAVLAGLAGLDSLGDAVRSALLGLIRSGRNGHWTSVELADLLDVVGIVWETSASPYSTPWLVQVVEELVGLPGVQAERLATLLRVVCTRLDPFVSQADQVWLDQLQAIVGDIHQFATAATTPTSAAAVPWNRLAGRRAGLHG